MANTPKSKIELKIKIEKIKNAKFPYYVVVEIGNAEVYFEEWFSTRAEAVGFSKQIVLKRAR